MGVQQSVASLSACAVRVAKRSTLLSLSSFLLVLTLPVHILFGQAFSELPRAEYYVAKELYGAGRLNEAAEGFRVAVQRARKVGEQRWVDSVPPLVMLGECFYQQGNLPAALEQYDAALMLVLNNQNWVNELDYGVEQLPFLEGQAKGIDWFTRSRPSRSVAVPEAIQIAIDPTRAEPIPGGNGAAVAPVSLVSRLDATEVMRTIGVAMLRRWEIFGPLAQHSPLAEPMAQYFQQAPRTPAPWVHSAWTVLYGISQLSSAANADAPLRLRQGVLIADQFDYFMSPLALIALAELQAKDGNYQNAIQALQDATLFSAFFEQHAELAISLERLASLACATRQTQMLPSLQRASVWCNKRSLLAFVAGHAGASELALYAKNPKLADQLSGQAANAMRPRDVILPRIQAQLAYNSALAAFAQDRSAAGFQSLNQALALMRGNAQNGSAVEIVFQIQMTLGLLADNKLTTIAAEDLLTKLLAEPGPEQWLSEPLKTLTGITTASIPAFERHLEMAQLRGDEPEMLLRMDRLQRQRLYEALPLGGRLLAWREALETPPAVLGQQIAPLLQRATQEFPNLLTVRDRIRALKRSLKAGPLPLDERQLPADAKKQYAELERVSQSLESALAQQALWRRAMPRILPGLPSLTDLRESLDDSEMVLSFVPTSQAIFAVALRKNEVAFWQLANVAGVTEILGQVLTDIGLQGSPKVLPSEVTAANARWQQSTQQLRDVLQLNQIPQMMAGTKRLIIVPCDRFWYLPFELLPDATGQPWIASRSICYVPTLGSVSMSRTPFEKPRETVGVQGKIFSKQTEDNKEIAARVLRVLPNSHAVNLTEKVTVPSSTWLRLSSDQVWVAANPTVAPTVWDRSMIALPKSKQSTLGSWLRTPQATPRSFVAPAMTTSVGSPQLGNGNDLFLPACAAMLGGTKSAVLSRWSVGGKSTASLLMRYLVEREVSDSSTAWRRATLALWPKDFLISDEPALMPAGREADELTAGRHPLLWAGYMCIGDELQN